MARRDRADNAEDDLNAFEAAGQLASEAGESSQLLPGIIDPGQRVIVFGEPGVGKTLLACQAAYSLAKKITFYGVKIPDDVGFGYEGAHIAYLQAEGARSKFNNRLRALEIHNASPIGSAKLFVGGATNFSSSRAVKNLKAELSEKMGLVDLLVSDTFPACHGGDEDRTADAIRLIRTLKEISDDLGCAHLLLTHPGHRNPDRPRGAKAFVGDVDAVFKVSRTKAGLIAVVAKKVRDAEAPPGTLLRIKKIDLGIRDQYGNPVTAPVLVLADEAPMEKSVRLTAPQLIALQALRNVIENRGISPPDEVRDRMPVGQLIIDLSTWRTAAFELGFPGKTSVARAKAFKRAVQALVDEGSATAWANFFWPNHGQREQISHLSDVSNGQISHPPIQGVGLSSPGHR
jgi:hypothetical protein